LANHITSFAYNAVPVEIGDALSTTGLFSVCLSYNAGGSYVQQISSSVEALPPNAQPDSIDSFSPNNFFVQSTPTLTLSGHVPSSQTKIGFSQDDCTTIFGETSLPIGWASLLFKL